MSQYRHVPDLSDARTCVYAYTGSNDSTRPQLCPTYPGWNNPINRTIKDFCPNAPDLSPFKIDYGRPDGSAIFFCPLVKDMGSQAPAPMK
jgi:hypothetical protein